MSKTLDLRLEHERKRLNFSRADIARICNVNEKTIYRWEKEGVPVPSDKLELLANAGFNVFYIITGSNSQHDKTNIVNIPLYDISVAAGDGIELSDEQIIKYVPYDVAWLQSFVQPNHCACFKVQGDSMHPAYHDGDIVMADLSVTSLGYGESGVFIFRQGVNAHIKILQKVDEHNIQVISKNSIYPPYMLSNDALENFAIIGRVVWPRVY